MLWPWVGWNRIRYKRISVIQHYVSYHIFFSRILEPDIDNLDISIYLVNISEIKFWIHGFGYDWILNVWIQIRFLTLLGQTDISREKQMCWHSKVSLHDFELHVGAFDGGGDQRTSILKSESNFSKATVFIWYRFGSTLDPFGLSSFGIWWK